MFSFFSKKTQSSDSPIIQGPATETPSSGGDDFIFVEKKGDGPVPQPSHPQMPQSAHSMPQSFGTAPYPRFPYGPDLAGTGQRHVSQTAVPVPYVQDIPFVLAPQLCTKATFENTQTEVDGILAFLTRQMSVDEHEDYNFALERSIQNECY